MGSTALEDTEEGHDQIHPVANPDYPVARRSSLNSECSSLVRFSGFSSVPAGARMFSLVMLALILTWPCDFGVGAVNFTFNGFKENDVYLVSDSSWNLDPASCFYFTALNASASISVAGRFLNQGLVQMRDPVSKKVKSFSTTFIYQIWGNSSRGPGMAFIIVSDNVTLGAPGDYMGLLTATPKNYESDNHTFGVELDTYKNLEFNDPSDNHIGINLASMNSTYTCKPDYNLASGLKGIYQQIWIDYFEADSRMDISYAYYGQDKPGTPQGSQRGLDLSFINDNMYIGFSSAKGKESDNLPFVCAWSFSNDGLPAPPIVVGRDVPPAAPPSSPGLQPPAPAPASGHSSNSRIAWTITGISIISTLFLVVILTLVAWLVQLRLPFRIFISCAGEPAVGFQDQFTQNLHDRMRVKSLLGSLFNVVAYANNHFRARNLYSEHEISRELARCDVGIVVLGRDFFGSEWATLDLITLFKASKNAFGKCVQIIPVFYEHPPDLIFRLLRSRAWIAYWEKMNTGNHHLEVIEWQELAEWLTIRTTGITYDFRHSGYEDFLEDVVQAIYKIWFQQRCYSLFSSSLRGAMTAIAKWGCKRRLTGVKEIGVMTYVQKMLHLLFALSGLLIIFSSVILDNSFNHQPQRFIAFAILAPVMIFLGILASGWFPRIPLWLIACLKRRGFLKHVSACSPWHDNVVTDFYGDICTLEPLQEAEGTTFLELHQPLLSFLYGISFSPQGTRVAPESQGAVPTLEPQGECFHWSSISQPQNEDSSIFVNLDYEDAGMSEIIEIPPPTIQASLPNFLEAPSRGEDIIIPIDHSSKFYVLDEARVPTLTLKGPKINCWSLEVQIFKDTSSRDPTFDLTCTFRNKRTRKMFLTLQRVLNLSQNMYRWVENPHLIVTNNASDILHCLAIEDTLWKFTKVVYSFKPICVQHRSLAGCCKVGAWVGLVYAALWSFLSLFPLLSEKKSYFFLFSLVVLVPYLFTSKDANPLNFYNLRELFCPVFIYACTFNKLYMSRSSFIWCNEFRKQRVVNPEIFWIDEEYSNNFSDREDCFDVYGFVDIPATPIIQSSS